MTAYGWATHVVALMEAVTGAFHTRRRPGNEMKGADNCGKIS